MSSPFNSGTSGFSALGRHASRPFPLASKGWSTTPNNPTTSPRFPLPHLDLAKLLPLGSSLLEEGPTTYPERQTKNRGDIPLPFSFVPSMPSLKSQVTHLHCRLHPSLSPPSAPLQRPPLGSLQAGQLPTHRLTDLLALHMTPLFRMLAWPALA